MGDVVHLSAFYNCVWEFHGQIVRRLVNVRDVDGLTIAARLYRPDPGWQPYRMRYGSAVPPLLVATWANHHAVWWFDLRECPCEPAS